MHTAFEFSPILQWKSLPFQIESIDTWGTHSCGLWVVACYSRHRQGRSLSEVAARGRCGRVARHLSTLSRAVSPLLHVRYGFGGWFWGMVWGEGGPFSREFTACFRSFRVPAIRGHQYGTATGVPRDQDPRFVRALQHRNHCKLRGPLVA